MKEQLFKCIRNRFFNFTCFHNADYSLQWNLSVHIAMDTKLKIFCLYPLFTEVICNLTEQLILIESFWHRLHTLLLVKNCFYWWYTCFKCPQISRRVTFLVKMWMLEYGINFSFLASFLVCGSWITENKATLLTYFQYCHNIPCLSFKPSSLFHYQSVKINTALWNKPTFEWGMSDGSSFIVIRLWTSVTDLLNKRLMYEDSL